MTPRPTRDGLHPRNRFCGGYDFAALVQVHPALARFVVRHAHGTVSIDFADPAAVKALNQALLKHAYGILSWDVPPGSLCPPIPGRSDYLHHLADLLADGVGGGVVPRGPAVRVLDIGVGANGIYPLIGAREYGWRFVGTDIDRAAVRHVQKLVTMNPALAGLIECRLQPTASAIFSGVVQPGERFDASMCNPPFHASAAAAAAGTREKLKNLRGAKPGRPASPVLNFGGRAGELWCPGGELGFIRRTIAESARLPGLCRWFTSLVSKSVHLPQLYQTLRDAGAAEVRTIDMAQGQKKSRILAWRFMVGDTRRAP